NKVLSARIRGYPEFPKCYGGGAVADRADLTVQAPPDTHYCNRQHRYPYPMSDLGTQQSSLKALIAKGKEQNYLTFAEVNDHLPESISDPDQVEDIIQMIDDMGIKVYETAPDADQLLLIENETTDELAA